ncbi:DUF6361 family protein [Rhodoglobus aureus]|uniref:DUF6361 family protein n=1 Tax=Rhodoglobus aureus TaxID=191497 RepID=A0ABP4G5Y1_9MICO
MPSLIAWLDASSEDQRRMREIVNLFSERDSRDELGIGQIRDVLSDTLFPGTSTLLTRARYMLLIPWAFAAAAKQGLDADEIARRVEKNERNLIATLKRDTDGEGLLGKTAGAALKTLPSSTYWAALRQYGILADPSQSQADAIAASIRNPADDDETSYSVGPWSPTLPPFPSSFPNNTGGGFDLNRIEAEWLRDRMLNGSEGSLLAHFIDHRPQSETAAPWLEPGAVGASSNSANHLFHARMFSQAVNGASLLYNLLLAEAYEAAGYDRVIGRVDAYRERLSEWQNDRDQASMHLSSWDRSDFWALAYAKNPRINGSSRAFVDTWLDAVTGSGSLTIADNEGLRLFIAQRERRHKGVQARLQNTRLLQSWQGASGAGAVTFRWRQVRGILTDLHDGLERADA